MRVTMRRQHVCRPLLSSPLPSCAASQSLVTLSPLPPAVTTLFPLPSPLSLPAQDLTQCKVESALQDLLVLLSVGWLEG